MNALHITTDTSSHMKSEEEEENPNSPDNFRFSGSMEELPSHLANEILFRLNCKSLARFKCVNRSYRSEISEPDFITGYKSRLTPGLIIISGFGSKYASYVPFVTGNTDDALVKMPTPCQILGSVSGLVLLFNGLVCILNPITKAFRVLGKESSSPLMLNIQFLRRERTVRIGFAVDQIDQTTQRFRIVSMMIDKVDPNSDTWIYRFEIYNDDNDSWRVSETMISCPGSHLLRRLKPAYLHGSFHWLRSDGSIVAFNPETDEAKLIPTTFPSPENVGFRVWFGAVDGNLTLVSVSEKVISVFVLRDGGQIHEWVLQKQINNDIFKKESCNSFVLVAYDGRFLAVEVEETTTGGDTRLLHVYDVVGAKEWRVQASMPIWMDSDSDFFEFSPSWFPVRGLNHWRFPWPSKQAAMADPSQRPLLSLDLFMQMIDLCF